MPSTPSSSTPSPSSDEPILTITGPTAVGKTELSVNVAKRLNAEIISADSRQVYRELNIGTATPGDALLDCVPHHFINERSIASPPFSAGAFADEANTRIRNIRSRGRRAVVVGGSTLYIHALQEGLADIPDVPASVRQRLEERLEQEGPDVLFQELQDIDPQQAERCDPTKTHRVIRALEVYHHTGRPLTDYYDHQPEPPFTYQTVVLRRERELLYERINERVDQMLDAGLLDEVEDVMRLDVQLDEAPLSTIGYREPIQYLKGEMEYDEMVRRMKRNTRRYAKRQLTWFRRYDDYIWIEAETATSDQIVDMAPYSDPSTGGTPTGGTPDAA